MLSKDEQNKEEINQFLANSYEFQQLTKIAKVNPENTRYGHWIKSIAQSNSLVNLLYLTADVDPKTTDNVVAHYLGRNKVNAALYVSGFFSNDANFTYYLLHLREKIEDYLHSDDKKNNSPKLSS